MCVVLCSFDTAAQHTRHVLNQTESTVFALVADDDPPRMFQVQPKGIDWL